MGDNFHSERSNVYIAGARYALQSNEKRIRLLNNDESSANWIRVVRRLKRIFVTVRDVRVSNVVNRRLRIFEFRYDRNEIRKRVREFDSKPIICLRIYGRLFGKLKYRNTRSTGL